MKCVALSWTFFQPVLYVESKLFISTQISNHDPSHGQESHETQDPLGILPCPVAQMPLADAAGESHVLDGDAVVVVVAEGLGRAEVGLRAGDVDRVERGLAQLGINDFVVGSVFTLFNLYPVSWTQ